MNLYATEALETTVAGLRPEHAALLEEIAVLNDELKDHARPERPRPLQVHDMWIRRLAPLVRLPA